MIIDATNLILGRLASYVSKRSLLGERIDIVNCESAIITGNWKNIFQKYKIRSSIGTPMKGPFYPKIPDRFVRRAIRGMLPYKKEKGRKAFERVMCYIGVPEKFKDKAFSTVQEADVKKMGNLKYVTVSRICEYLGGRK